MKPKEALKPNVKNIGAAVVVGILVLLAMFIPPIYNMVCEPAPTPPSLSPIEGMTVVLYDYTCMRAVAITAAIIAYTIVSFLLISAKPKKRGRKK